MFFLVQVLIFKVSVFVRPFSFCSYSPPFSGQGEQGSKKKRETEEALSLEGKTRDSTGGGSKKRIF
jgi:hypothetical protein